MVKKFDRGNIATDGTVGQAKERFAPGEIWMAECTHTQRMVLIVAVGDTYCTTLRLDGDPPGEEYETACIVDDYENRYYCRPGMMSFRFFQNMMGKVGEIVPSDMIVLKKMIGKHLGLEEKKEQKPKESDARTDKERDFYREEYYRLIDRLMGKQGGTHD